MEFQQVHNNIWYVRQPLELFGIDIGSVMTIVRVQDGSVVIFSPVDPIDELIDEIAKLGPVRAVVSPNRLQQQNARRFMAYYPDCCYYFPPGLDQRLPRRLVDLPNRKEILREETTKKWGDDLVALKITGMPFVNEFVFYHKESRTLIATDLLLNIESSEGLWARLFWPMIGIKVGTPGQSRLFKLCIRDKGLYNASIQRILELDIERVILNHGAMIEAQGPEIIERLKAV